MNNRMDELNMMNEVKKEGRTTSRFLEYLIKEKVVPVHYRDWKEQDDIVKYWGKKSKGRHEGPFKQYQRLKVKNDGS